MRALSLLLVVITGLACGPTEQIALTRTGPVTGAVQVPEGLTGDGWLFLFRSGEGPPGVPTAPLAATAVSALRLPTDPHFVFADVRANAYRLWGFLDVDSNFDPTIDVLSQPSAQDRVGEGVELQVQPGRGASVDYPISVPIPTDPPAFVIEGARDDVPLDQLPGTTTPITLVSDGVGHFSQAAFSVGLVDANGDGRPDDTNGDNVPDFSLVAFLHWLPKPGQLPSGSVVVPVTLNPSPFLQRLEGRVGVTVSVTRLQLFVVPVAQWLTTDEAGRSTVTPIGAPPAGDWELVLQQASGQFWRLPNALADELPSQGVRLHFDRVSP